MNIILKKNIKYLVIHCSDTIDDLNITAIDIHNMHIGFGWDGIGYHKIINKNGVVENGRPEYWVGAHVKGKNHESLGVCLIGRKQFTPEQYETLKKVLVKWKGDYPKAKIVGHREAIKTEKTCPNFDVREWCRNNGLL